MFLNNFKLHVTFVRFLAITTELIIGFLFLKTIGCQAPQGRSHELNSRASDRIGDIMDDEVPYPNQEIDLRGRYAGIAKNLYTEQIYRETANDRTAALQRAIKSCRQFAFQEAGCVGIRTYSTVLLPTSYGEGFGSWNCFAETSLSNFPHSTPPQFP